MRHLEKADVIGKRIADVIVSVPDKPVTMSDQSHSPGFLRLDTGDIINLGSYAPPLASVQESEIQKLVRDRKYEKNFRPALGQTISEILFPDETEDGESTLALPRWPLPGSSAARLHRSGSRPPMVVFCLPSSALPEL